MSKRKLVTSALPYANGPIHLGHLAGAYLPADLYTRFQRLKGEDIIHICGSDEHGVPITIAAEKEGVSPQEIVDRYHERNKAVFDKFGIDFDYYGRTSSETHKKTSQDFFLKLYEQGVFKKKSQEQFYDEDANMFLPDRYVKGTCPKCGHPEAYGDQCEKCGSSLSPTDLIDPVSALTGNKPVAKSTEHWFIPLGDFQDRLQEWIDSRKDWKPNVVGQCKSWLDSGLGDRAVTRDLTWGVPVPLPEGEGKVLYVWFDAPIGYISATKEWADEKGDPELWKTYWQDEETSLIHFIGKDNIVFHCIMFPAMLMQHGEFVLPENVPANEFLNLEGRKLSTSKGWAVWLEEYLDKFEPDLLRYVLGTTLPEAKDSDFSWKDFQNRINGELADILGNFVFRTVSFTERFFDGSVPELSNPTELDLNTLKEIENQKQKIEEAYNSFKFREAIAETMNLARIGNRYFTETEPWKTRKENPEACGNTLNVCVQISAALSVLFHPVLPAKMARLRGQLGVPNTLSWDDVTSNLIPSGQIIEQGEILFEKIEDDAVQEQIEILEKRAAESSGTESKEFEPLKETATFDDFVKLDFRAGKITDAKKIKKSKKLLNITVDLGFEKRTILSGIAEFFKAEDIVGRSVVVVANLAPKKMMGIESNGMILMGEDTEGKLHFVETDSEPGSPVM
ncbi:methionine--tRNA ligase [Rhodohalobacter barkolensis]|uniref:Methionine--tRNA ligase n=1 Tax=Rhodohalobacter barkolensis TaxID=2053187 RepID=A0A2N0VKR9_9BACT|nr:methionine--tRNA ligase [Rhodohalobacter barkolensis]PKD44795.1 methionine--tRNA ligase [Rhodohalobacter barkolensis]